MKRRSDINLRRGTFERRGRCVIIPGCNRQMLSVTAGTHVGLRWDPTNSTQHFPKWRLQRPKYYFRQKCSVVILYLPSCYIAIAWYLLSATKSIILPRYKHDHQESRSFFSPPRSRALGAGIPFTFVSIFVHVRTTVIGKVYPYQSLLGNTWYQQYIRSVSVVYVVLRIL